MSRDEEVLAAYAALGRFLQEFAHSCWSLQLLIISILERGGLRDQPMGWIVVGNRAMTANALIDMARHLMGHVHGGRDEPIFTDIANRFVKLTENRNNLVHGITFVGWKDEEDIDWTKFEAFKISSSRRGSEITELPGSPDELDAWISEAAEITTLVLRYMGCLRGGFELKNNFVHRDRHWRTADPSP